jgi:hypothetical protein
LARAEDVGRYEDLWGVIEFALAAKSEKLRGPNLGNHIFHQDPFPDWNSH